MATFYDYVTSIANVRRHLAMLDKIKLNTLVPVLRGRTFYEFVGSDVYEALRMAMAETILVTSEQALDLNISLGMDTLPVAADYQYLIKVRDWAIEEVKHWHSDRLSDVELICNIGEDRFVIPSSSASSELNRDTLREQNLRRLYDGVGN